jgi:general stress protein 26
MKTTTVERDPQAFAKLRELVQDIEVAMLVTVTTEGGLRSRPMMTLSLEEQGELRFITTDETGTVEDLNEEKAVNVCYADHENRRYVSVSGQATISRDHGKLEQLWNPAFERFVPQGLDDPHLILLRVRIEYAEFWDTESGRMGRVQDEAATAGKHDDRPRTPRASSPGHANAGPAPGRDDGSDDGHTKLEVRATPASG